MTTGRGDHGERGDLGGEAPVPEKDTRGAAPALPSRRAGCHWKRARGGGLCSGAPFPLDLEAGLGAPAAVPGVPPRQSTCSAPNTVPIIRTLWFWGSGGSGQLQLLTAPVPAAGQAGPAESRCPHDTGGRRVHHAARLCKCARVRLCVWCMWACVPVSATSVVTGNTLQGCNNAKRPGGAGGGAAGLCHA